LEWQASEGGGTIVENGRVTVNNAAAVASWERAAGWIGSISPPAVLEYMEPDVYNVWSSTNAAFARSWPFESAFDGREMPEENVGVAPLPKGAIRRAATLGRSSFGVSRRSPHPP
jgi:trehalose/maltose transport system substrate-binding protein